MGTTRFRKKTATEATKEGVTHVSKFVYYHFFKTKRAMIRLDLEWRLSLGRGEERIRNDKRGLMSDD